MTQKADEQRTQEAFKRVRSDVSYLKSQVDSLHKVSTLNSDIRRDIEYLKEINVDKFIKEMELEFSTLNRTTADFRKRFEETAKLMDEFSKKMEIHHKDLVEIREMQKAYSTSNREVEELKRLVHSSETRNNAEMQKIYTYIDNKFNSLRNDLENQAGDVRVMPSEVSRRDLSELAEIINEKIDMENAALKMEIFEMLQNDETSAPVKQAKASKKKETKKTKETPAPKKVEEKKDGKAKRFAKWLFVDDEEDELQSIKNEIKNN